MNSVRINISLPEETFKELLRDIGSRKRSRFIAQAVKSSLKELQKKRSLTDCFDFSDYFKRNKGLFL